MNGEHLREKEEKMEAKREERDMEMEREDMGKGTIMEVGMVLV